MTIYIVYDCPGGSYSPSIRRVFVDKELAHEFKREYCSPFAYIQSEVVCMDRKESR